jgi:hypothetical protein
MNYLRDNIINAPRRAAFGGSTRGQEFGSKLRKLKNERIFKEK